MPGEAGTKAIRQRTLGLAGIPSATAEARTFDGHQAAGERMDRPAAWARQTRRRLASEGVDPGSQPHSDDKYDSGRRPGPQWSDAYQLLRQRAADPHSDPGIRSDPPKSKHAGPGEGGEVGTGLRGDRQRRARADGRDHGEPDAHHRGIRPPGAAAASGRRNTGWPVAKVSGCER